MYIYEEMDFGCIIIQKFSGVKGESELLAEVFLQGDDAVTFLREMNRAEQKEKSKRRNPNNIPRQRNAIAGHHGLSRYAAS
jgi:hypothetical protein